MKKDISRKFSFQNCLVNIRACLMVVATDLKFFFVCIGFASSRNSSLDDVHHSMFSCCFSCKRWIPRGDENDDLKKTVIVWKIKDEENKEIYELNQWWDDHWFTKYENDIQLVIYDNFIYIPDSSTFCPSFMNIICSDIQVIFKRKINYYHPNLR